MSDRIYLDHAATTSLRPTARAAMEPYLADTLRNPASTHGPGREARRVLEEARARVADALGASPAEIVFTGGGTEADNLAILGSWRAAGTAVIHSAIEHSAVRRSAAAAAREGADIGVVAVNEEGVLDLDALAESLEGAGPALVSVMWGNNEVGVVQRVAEIGALCRDRGALFHTDAVQAVGHVAVSVRDVDCHLLALSAHKFGGPRGIGALYVREGVALAPLIHGGGQEGGLRPGTVNVAGAVGLASALEEAVNEVDVEARRLEGLRDRLQTVLTQAVPDLTVNAGGAPRLPHILNVSLPVETDVLLASLDMAGLAVSAGSACHSGAAAPSHVLVAMGRSGGASVRFSLGHSTRDEDVVRAGEIFRETVDRVRGVTA